ncbi:DUF1771 domain-containing protein [Candidatus Saccharibacteria bacterium]|nr:DUF1771 domain-containing protein [Candidatus Saccharibacteria bacterium]
MSRSYELDRIKSEEQSAFNRKQSAWERYDEARNAADAAHDVMQSAWTERVNAREEMNREYEALQDSNARHDEVWNEYSRIRDYNNSRIDSLRSQADYEHQEMQRCFEQASSEYQYGDKSMAPAYSQEGHEHKARRDELNAEVSKLIQEIKDAKQNAEWRAPKTDSSAYKSARSRFEQAKTRHESAESEFKRLKSVRDSLKREFESAQAEHKRLKEEFQHKLEEIKSQNQRERERVLDKAGINFLDRKDAKIVKKADGTTQIYSGGLGLADGLGHGHVALDSSGHKVYERKAFEKHGSQNYTDEPTRWDGPHQGVILGKERDYEVTFSQGMGKKAGQTIIADGHLSESYFHSRMHHNHYGLDTKYSNGTERIENKGGDRGAYTGPGH